MDQLDKAASVLPNIAPPDVHRIVKFLEARGLKEQALQVSTDFDHRFELALELQKLELGLQLLQRQETKRAQEGLSVDGLSSKWKQLGDLALSLWEISLAEKCWLKSNDLGSLLMLYTA